MISIILILACVGSINALDVTIGLDSCTSGCTNYYKASTSDAHPVIQKAMNDVYASGGGKVTILPGTYIVGKYIDVYTDTAIEGAGMDQTILKLKDYASPWRVGSTSRSGFLRATYKNIKVCKNLSFVGMTLDGNKVNQNTDDDSLYGRYGLFTEGCTNVLVDDVHIKNWQGYGFDPHGWKEGNVYGKNLVIKNCIATDNDWDGFTLDQTDGMVIENCTAINNGRHGFNVVTGSLNALLKNISTVHNGFYYYTGATGCGVMIQNNQQKGTRSVTVTNTVLYDDKKGGVCTNDVYDITMTSNTITTSDKCFLFTNSRNMTVTNNVCTATAKKFIVNVGSTNIIEGNNILTWVVSPPPLAPADPTCSTGLLNTKRTICCVASCGTCGGTGCSGFSGGSSGCCTTPITNSGKLCSSNPPPCIMG
jgi:parallel beta-helix repeat protein